jgi:branched-chain amino acid transport system substrate-binding protein
MKPFHIDININIKIKVITFIVISIALIVYGLYHHSSMMNPPIKIGVAVPLTGSGNQYANEMLKGIHITRDLINQKGGVHGRKVDIVIHDDKNDKSVAMKVASTFSLDNQILIVLGHYLSSTSIVAGNIYKKNGLSAITASATSSRVTFNNPWYFRVIPNNVYQAKYMAYILKTTIDSDRCILIHDKDEYGQDLARSFLNTTRHSGIHVDNIYAFHSKDRHINQTIDTIALKIIKKEKPGAIIMAVHANEAIQLIFRLKDSGKNFIVIGPDSFSSTSFINRFKAYPKERAKIGYYTDNIFSVLPFMTHIPNSKALQFIDTYKKLYACSPTWVAAAYHDAFGIALEAIERSEIKPDDPIYINRRRVKDALFEFSNSEQSYLGVTGRIFFNIQGDTEKNLITAFYDKQNLVPCYAQYNPSNEKGGQQHPQKENNAFINNDRKGVTNIVYSGTHLISINRIDISKKIFHASFYLWFKYQRPFNARNIEFINACHPITIGTPIFHEKNNSVTNEVYHLNGMFTIIKEKQSSTQNQYYLNIQFRHKHLTRDNLIFIADDHSKAYQENEISFLGWSITETESYQDVIYDNDLSGLIDIPENQAYSVFTSKAKIKRDDPLYTLRYMLPLIFLFIHIFFIYFIPPAHAFKSLILISIFICLIGIYHYHISYFQIYIDAHQNIIGIIFPVFYGLGAISFAFLACTAYLFSSKNLHNIAILKFFCIIIQLLTIFWGGKCYLEMLS